MYKSKYHKYKSQYLDLKQVTMEQMGGTIGRTADNRTENLDIAEFLNNLNLDITQVTPVPVTINKISCTSVTISKTVKQVVRNEKQIPNETLQEIHFEDLGGSSNSPNIQNMELGEEAFGRFTALTKITLPNDVNKIGSAAFHGCTSLTTITIPSRVKRLETALFLGCTSLTTITIPPSVTFISDRVFVDCTSLTTITIPDGVKRLEYSLFRDCTSLTTITIPDSVTFIGHTFCEGCTLLTTINIPDNVSEIDNSAFKDCTSLVTITIPEGLTKLADWLFQGCTSLTTIPIPVSVTEIRVGVFDDCTSLTTITIPDGVKKLEYALFRGCTSLTTITIPPSVTYIGPYLFEGCTSLTTITIPPSVKVIDNRSDCGIFERCTSLTEVTIYDNNIEMLVGKHPIFNECKIQCVSFHYTHTEEGDTLDSLIPFLSLPGLDGHVNKIRLIKNNDTTKICILEYDTTQTNNIKFSCNNSNTYGEILPAQMLNPFGMTHLAPEVMSFFDECIYIKEVLKKDREFSIGIKKLFQRLAVSRNTHPSGCQKITSR